MYNVHVLYTDSTNHSTKTGGVCMNMYGLPTTEQWCPICMEPSHKYYIQ